MHLNLLGRQDRAGRTNHKTKRLVSSDRKETRAACNWLGCSKDHAFPCCEPELDLARYLMLMI